MSAPWLQVDSEEFISRTNTDIQGDLQFGSSSGSVGQIILKTGANTQAWSNLPAGTNYVYKVIKDSPNNVNVGANTFINGTVSVNINNPFTFDGLTGIFTAVVSGTYRWHLETTLSNSLVQTKFKMVVNSVVTSTRTNIYIPSLTTDQPFISSDIFTVTAGQTVVPTFEAFGVSGILNNSGLDATYNNPTTYIIFERIN